MVSCSHHDLHFGLSKTMGGNLLTQVFTEINTWKENVVSKEGKMLAILRTFHSLCWTVQNFQEMCFHNVWKGVAINITFEAYCEK